MQLYYLSILSRRGNLFWDCNYGQFFFGFPNFDLDICLYCDCYYYLYYFFTTLTNVNVKVKNISSCIYREGGRGSTALMDEFLSRDFVDSFTDECISVQVCWDLGPYKSQAIFLWMPYTNFGVKTFFYFFFFLIHVMM